MNAKSTIVSQLARDYNLTYEEAVEVIRAQRKLAEYKTTYAAK